MSTSPVSVDAPGYDQSVCTNVAVESDSDLLIWFLLTTKSNFEPSVCPMLINEPEYDLSSCRVSVIELSASASVNAPGFELPASSTPANTVDSEWFVCLVSVSESVYELPACPVSVSEPVYELSACQSQKSKSALLSILRHVPYIQRIEIALLSYSLVHTDNTKH